MSVKFAEVSGSEGLFSKVRSTTFAIGVGIHLRTSAIEYGEQHKGLPPLPEEILKSILGDDEKEGKNDT